MSVKAKEFRFELMKIAKRNIALQAKLYEMYMRLDEIEEVKNDSN